MLLSQVKYITIDGFLRGAEYCVTLNVSKKALSVGKSSAFVHTALAVRMDMDLSTSFILVNFFTNSELILMSLRDFVENSNFTSVIKRFSESMAVSPRFLIWAVTDGFRVSSAVVVKNGVLRLGLGTT